MIYIGCPKRSFTNLTCWSVISWWTRFTQELVSDNANCDRQRTMIAGVEEQKKRCAIVVLKWFLLQNTIALQSMFEIPFIRHNACFTTSAHGLKDPFKFDRYVTDTCRSHPWFCREIYFGCCFYPSRGKVSYAGRLSPLGFGDPCPCQMLRASSTVWTSCVPQVEIQGNQARVSRWPCNWSASANSAIRIYPIEVFSHSVAEINRPSTMLKLDVSVCCLKNAILFGMRRLVSR